MLKYNNKLLGQLIIYMKVSAIQILKLLTKLDALQKYKTKKKKNT